MGSPTVLLGVDTTQIVAVLITVLLGGGFIGGVIALLKLRPEAGQITVTAAQGAVIVQTTVIEQLQAENRRIRELYDQALARLTTLEKAMGSLAQAHRRIEALEEQRNRLEEENQELRGRVTNLEDELDHLRENGK